MAEGVLVNVVLVADVVKLSNGVLKNVLVADTE